MKTILLLTDFTNRADRAAELALDLAKNNRTNLLLYNSVVLLEPAMYLAGENSELQKGKMDSETNLAQLAEQLKSKLTDSEVTISYESGTGSVKDSVLNIVSDHDVWLVVMGSNINSDLHYQFSDSNVFSVIGNSGCPVVLVP